MLMETVSNKNAFRALRPEEMTLVAGGDAPPAPIPGMIYDEMTGQYELGCEMGYLDGSVALWGGDADSGVDGFGPYVEGQDYCGPESSPFLSALVPDSIEGIDISYACYIHDANYSSGSDMDRADADALFGQQVYSLLVAGGMDGSDAMAYASNYYHAVSVAGGLYYEGSGQN